MAYVYLKCSVRFVFLLVYFAESIDLGQTLCPLLAGAARAGETLHAPSKLAPGRPGLAPHRRRRERYASVPPRLGARRLRPSQDVQKRVS